VRATEQLFQRRLDEAVDAVRARQHYESETVAAGDDGGGPLFERSHHENVFAPIAPPSSTTSEIPAHRAVTRLFARLRELQSAVSRSAGSATKPVLNPKLLALTRDACDTARDVDAALRLLRGDINALDTELQAARQQIVVLTQPTSRNFAAEMCPFHAALWRRRVESSPPPSAAERAASFSEWGHDHSGGSCSVCIALEGWKQEMTPAAPPGPVFQEDLIHDFLPSASETDEATKVTATREHHDAIIRVASAAMDRLQRVAASNENLLDDSAKARDAARRDCGHLRAAMATVRAVPDDADIPADVLRETSSVALEFCDRIEAALRTSEARDQHLQFNVTETSKCIREVAMAIQ
jgi:hypothetical protein